ncbi:5309_t:CDS:2, partial [Dentiscutata erythropus]
SYNEYVMQPSNCSGQKMDNRDNEHPIIGKFLPKGNILLSYQAQQIKFVITISNDEHDPWSKKSDDAFYKSLPFGPSPT